MQAKSLSKKRVLLVALVLSAVTILMKQGGTEMFYESAYPKSPVGEIEVKAIPSALKLTAAGRGKNYFSSANNSFMTLFRYIQRNEVKMTVPVEAYIEKNEMKFFVGTKDLRKGLSSSKNVDVNLENGKMVLSIGLRGPYTVENFIKGKEQLLAWLTRNQQYQSIGEAYAVYWNSPFCPGFLKRSEVHIPIERQPAS